VRTLPNSYALCLEFWDSRPIVSWVVIGLAGVWKKSTTAGIPSTTSARRFEGLFWHLSCDRIIFQVRQSRRSLWSRDAGSSTCTSETYGLKTGLLWYISLFSAGNAHQSASSASSASVASFVYVKPWKHLQNRLDVSIYPGRA
jgi:hypothetical protein